MTVLTVQQAWRIMDACGANAGGGGFSGGGGRGEVVIAERGLRGGRGPRGV